MTDLAELLTAHAPDGLDLAIVGASDKKVQVLARRGRCRCVVTFDLGWWDELTTDERIAWVKRDLGEADKRIRALVNHGTTDEAARGRP